MTLNMSQMKSFPCMSFKASGQLSIRGRFISKNPFEYGARALQWLEQYATSPAPCTELHISLEYLNGDSAKYMMQLLRILKSLEQKNCQLNITWEVSDDDEDLKETVGLLTSLLELEVRIRECCHHKKLTQQT